MSRQFELNKALFEAVTACFDYHIDLSTCTNIPNGLQNATLTIRDPKAKKSYGRYPYNQPHRQRSHTMTETFNIAGYTRISVDDELDRDNVSIENQKAIIEDFVKRSSRAAA